jgi:hypothetical protein
MKLGKLTRDTTLHLAGRGRVVVPAGTLVKVCWKNLQRGIVFHKTVFKNGREINVPIRAITRCQVLEFIGFQWLGGFVRAPHDNRVYQIDPESGEVIGVVEFPEWQTKGECYPFTMLPPNRFSATDR